MWQITAAEAPTWRGRIRAWFCGFGVDRFSGQVRAKLSPVAPGLPAPNPETRGPPSPAALFKYCARPGGPGTHGPRSSLARPGAGSVLAHHPNHQVPSKPRTLLVATQPHFDSA